MITAQQSSGQFDLPISMIHRDGEKTTLLGTLTITGSISSADIKLTSTDCDPKVSKCDMSILDIDFSGQSQLDCELKFTGSMMGQTKNTLTCNKKEVDLDQSGVVLALKDAVNRVNQASIEGVDHFSLACPGWYTFNGPGESDPGLVY